MWGLISCGPGSPQGPARNPSFDFLSEIPLCFAVAFEAKEAEESRPPRPRSQLAPTSHSGREATRPMKIALRLGSGLKMAHRCRT